METITQFFDSLAADNIWIRIGMLLAAIVVLFLLGRFIKFLIHRITRKKILEDKQIYGTFLDAIGKSVTLLLISIGISIGLEVIEVPEKFTELATTISYIVWVIAIGMFIFYLADVPVVWFEMLIEKTDREMNRMFLPVIRKSLRVLIIILILIQIVQFLVDKPITSIIAGLGIGGLAVALAAQDSIKHFFGSFVLAGDKPFEIGERVVIDGHDGPVESIGLRSTRIRTLEGHQVTIPNGELANRTIQNIGKRPFIRRVANITITYDTPPEKIERAVGILKEILDNHEGMDPELPPRVYFSEFNSESLNLLVIYWYHPPDYWKYMEFTERINHQIFNRFSEEGIDFAFPTRTVYLAGDPKRPLDVGITEQEKGSE